MPPRCGTEHTLNESFDTVNAILNEVVIINRYTYPVHPVPITSAIYGRYWLKNRSTIVHFMYVNRLQNTSVSVT